MEGANHLGLMVGGEGGGGGRGGWGGRWDECVEEGDGLWMGEESECIWMWMWTGVVWGLILGLVLDDALMEGWAVLLDCDGPFVVSYQHDISLTSRFEYARVMLVSESM